MAKKQFKIRARLVFDGEVIVRAASRQDAEAIVEKSVGANLGEVHVNEINVQDWEFNLKSKAVIKRRQEEE